MRKLKLEDIKARAKEKGFELLSDVYINALSKLEWKCPEGHYILKKFNNIDQGSGCSVCKGNEKLTLAEVIFRGRNFGFIYQYGNYKNNKSKLTWYCTKGHLTIKTIPDIEQNRGCCICSGLERKTIEQIRDIGRSLGFELLSDSYLNTKQTLVWKCFNGHTINKTFSKVQSGSGCKICSLRYDKAQSGLYQYVLGLYPDALYNKPGFLKSKRLQLDVYIPSLKKAIELDGEHWHSLPEAIERDSRKNQECQEAGIELLRLGYYKHWHKKEEEAKVTISKFLQSYP